MAGQLVAPPPPSSKKPPQNLRPVSSHLVPALSTPPRTPWPSCPRSPSLCTCRPGRRHSSAQTRTPWTGSGRETQAQTQEREREMMIDGWRQMERNKHKEKDVRKDMTHHLILNHTRHICISKQSAIIFKQTTPQLRDADSFICFNVRHTALFLFFFPLSLSPERCSLINCRFKRHQQHKSDGLRELAKCTILVFFFVPFLSSVSESQTWAPGFR